MNSIDRFQLCNADIIVHELHFRMPCTNAIFLIRCQTPTAIPNNDEIIVQLNDHKIF